MSLARFAEPSPQAWSLRSSNREDLLFLCRKHVVDLADRGIRHLLDVGGKSIVIVLADLVILFLLLDHVEAVAANVPRRDPRRFRVFVRHFDPVSYTHLTLPTIYSV